MTCHNINGPGINGPARPFMTASMVQGTIYVIIFGPAGPLMFRRKWSG